MLIKEDLNKLKDIFESVFVDWKTNIVKRAIFSKAFCRLNAMPFKISMGSSTDGKADPEILMELQGTQDSQNNLEKE